MTKKLMSVHEVAKLTGITARTLHYYECTNKVLSGLGEMYVGDERFRNNIDNAGGAGTANFVKQAIVVYCSKRKV